MAEYKFKFSVIIPVYNVEKYLSETLDSVLNQSIGFENIQVILVNDGTPDSSGEICREYAQRYSENIIYIEKENGGVSSARNAGIPYVKGKYINFLDSDDKWDENAFSNAWSFFEEHYDEIDVLSCRVKKFDASDDWHILDFKFQKGDRVVDLTDEKKCTLVQSHAGTAIIKAEALEKGDRFSEGVKFGEDSMFINGIILRRLRYGVSENAVYYYRKRGDNSSATQLQNVNPDYYTVSPEAYYSSLCEKSLELYGEVVPYIQNVLIYDIGWRVREVPAEFILNDPKLYGKYCDLLRKYLLKADEKYIISNRVHKRIGYKIALLKLRDGTDLLSETHFDIEKEAIFYKDMSLLRLQSNHKLCHINISKIKKNPETGKDILVVEGLIAKWVLDCCKGENVDFVIRIGKKKYDVKRKPYSLIKEKSFYGEKNRYDSFRKKIEIDSFFEEKDRIKVEFCLTFSNKPYPITVNLGEFVPSADEFASAHRIFGPFIMTNRNTHITVRKSEDIESDRKILSEKTFQRLQKAGLSEYERIVKRTEEIKAELNGKKLWIIGDSLYKAGDNGEAFFKFMCKKAEDENCGILPVFAISSESKDLERLSSYGRVISPESEDFKSILLSSDKIIMSEISDFLISFLTKEERVYLGHLISSDVVLLDKDLIAKDKSETHGKFSTNISLYCVSREKQQKSILKSDGCYFKEEVALTGSAKFDCYNNEKEKLIVFLPHRMKDETAESFQKCKSFRFWNYIMNDRKLQFNMMRYGYKGVLCLPEEYREFADCFNENLFFRVMREDNYSEAFSKGAFLVTDYHPGFEFAYNEKPVIYAHYEELKKFYKHNPHRKGMFNFEVSGFGKICLSREETLEAITEMMKEKAVLKEEYKKRGDLFFSFKDKNNCQRVFEAIINS